MGIFLILIPVLLTRLRYKLRHRLPAGWSRRAGLANRAEPWVAHPVFEHELCGYPVATFWFWSHWAFVLLVLAISPTPVLPMFSAAVINDMMRRKRKGSLIHRPERTGGIRRGAGG